MTRAATKPWRIAILVAGFFVATPWAELFPQALTDSAAVDIVQREGWARIGWIVTIEDTVKHGDFDGNGETDFLVTYSTRTDEDDTDPIYNYVIVFQREGRGYRGGGSGGGFGYLSNARHDIIRAGSSIDWGPFASDPLLLKTDALKDQVGRVKVWYGGRFVELTGTPNSNDLDRVTELPDVVLEEYPGAVLADYGVPPFTFGDLDGDRATDLVLHIAFPDSLSRSDTSEVVIAVMGRPWDRRTETIYRLYGRSRQSLKILKAGTNVDWGLFREHPFRLKTDAVGYREGIIYLWYGGTFLPIWSSP